jgi:hypothetical protein
MSSEEFVAGAVKGAISWSEDKIRELARQFKDRKLAFIQDDETITLVKEQLKSGEWGLCSQYIKDPKLKILIQMGMTLRTLDQRKDKSRLNNLREKLLAVYGEKGLHISQFVQNRILSELIGAIVDTRSIGDMINKVESLLNNLEKQTYFLKNTDNEEKVLREIEIKLVANVPDTFIIFARDSAFSKGRALGDRISFDRYTVQQKIDENQILIFLVRT